MINKHLPYSFRIPLTLVALLAAVPAFTQSATVTVDLSKKEQIIDGFGAFQDGNLSREEWVTDLYYDDLGASIYRVDIVPQFVSPYGDLNVYSPWFMGGGTDSPLNLEDPDNPNGPEENRARTYTGPNDYSRDYGGYNAPIAVMGPDIDVNKAYFTYTDNDLIQVGKATIQDSGDFKLIASMWSPAPWLKISSGNSWNQNWWPGPVQGTPWPFVWGGNYAGGMLDVSDEPLPVFDDTELGGTGPTSALTQFARGLAAYLRGFQQYHDVSFYAISIQNELNFEQYYNSATYPLSSQYIAALKAARAELDRHPDLRQIKIMGPEDLLGNDAYGMWQYGGGDDVTHKNLHYLTEIAKDSAALAAIDFFCIHGYGRDGVSASGATSTSWDWWANGWEDGPAPGIPDSIAGFTDYGKKSWMTETSGENEAWLFPTDAFPSQGAWSLGLRIHQALTTGRQSAWVYWTFIDGEEDGSVTDFGLTNESQGNQSAKYNAAKHFFRYIRPGAYRVATTASDSILYVSAYTRDKDGMITVVLINGSQESMTPAISFTGPAPADSELSVYTSASGNYWTSSTVTMADGEISVTVPAYGIVTLTGAALSTAVSGVPPMDVPEVGQPEPNPSGGMTALPIRLHRPEKVHASLHDLNGRLLRTVCNQRLAVGNHRLPIDLEGLPRGLYTCRVQTASGTISRMLVKQ
ncbi:T9SS type A sorting domain-containing protein [Lewinella sp. IMCC34191]|uniref:T9SS type A sorting domain-containing protein n=1 Tax=Lewinella sp. IMCC34191 TaxID=2259172 RepID=UPI000E225AB7|nr:T9SS type A sorting domain-containing protein [Lewinella sp. IMCC34191]